MKRLRFLLALLVGGCLTASPGLTQQARQMARSTTGFGDSSLVITSDTLTSKTTFVTKAVSLAQVRKSLSKFSFDSVSSTGPLRALGTSFYTGVATFTAQPIVSSLSASQAVFTDGSKGLVSNAITGSGNVVMSASPTLTGTITGAAATFSGVVTHSSTTTLSGALTYGGVTLSNAVTGTGNMVLSASPTLTGTVVLTGTTITGTPTWSSSQAITLSTAAQPNITSVGTLTSLTLSGAVSGITTLSGSGAVSGFTTASFSSTGANTLVLNRVDAAGVNGLIELRRGGVAKAYVGLDASDNFTVFDMGPTARITVSSALLTLASTTTAVQALTATGNVTAIGQFIVNTSSGGPTTPLTTTGAYLFAFNTNGAILTGFGSTYDVLIANRAGNLAMGVLANTQNVLFGGGISATTGTFSGNVQVAALSRLYLDGGGDTFLVESSANVVQIQTGGSVAAQLETSLARFGRNVTPLVDNVYDLGSSSARWVELYINPASSGVGDTYICLSTAQQVHQGATCAASTRKIKQDIKPITNGLSKILALQPSSFTYQKGFYNGKADRGFIVEEAVRVDPTYAQYALRDELLSNGQTIKKGDPEAINYMAIIADLTQSVQDLQRQINLLKKSPPQLN